jgi:hypothetical protein
VRRPSGVHWFKVFSGFPIMRLISKRIAVVCIALALWSALAFAAHHHHSDATDSDQCVVCLAAHSAVPHPTFNLTATTFVIVSTFRAEPVLVMHRLVAFALTVRPPPEV